ncbi:hypothetical protein L1987_64226 [Smallanthus sonchifolius]|uniref:Uncharacterized protein n=1 Tax=Smallanthus sonchifolius TaxID=185202 RepID=A0ACB9CFG4_9ASTR|nr:hypothetical protein L1987_64226 [Smallanthus sonchifolius]
MTVMYVHNYIYLNDMLGNLSIKTSVLGDNLMALKLWWKKVVFIQHPSKLNKRIDGLDGEMLNGPGPE